MSITSELATLPGGHGGGALGMSWTDTDRAPVLSESFRPIATLSEGCRREGEPSRTPDIIYDLDLGLQVPAVS